MRLGAASIAFPVPPPTGFPIVAPVGSPVSCCAMTSGTSTGSAAIRPHSTTPLGTDGNRTGRKDGLNFIIVSSERSLGGGRLRLVGEPMHQLLQLAHGFFQFPDPRIFLVHLAVQPLDGG